MDTNNSHENRKRVIFLAVLTAILLLLLIIICIFTKAPKIHTMLNQESQTQNITINKVSPKRTFISSNFVSKNSSEMVVSGIFSSEESLDETILALSKFYSPVKKDGVKFDIEADDKKWQKVLKSLSYYFATNIEDGKLSYENGEFLLQGEALSQKAIDEISSVLNQNGVKFQNNISIKEATTAQQVAKKEIYELLYGKVIEFQTAKATLKADSSSLLDSIAALLKENPELSLTIEGHTDSDGNAEFNKKLSLDRANSVKEYLIKSGIDSVRIDTIGYGDTKEIAPNTNEANKQKNRRVEFKIREK
ncbi:OmpA family protein [Campylobacter geochelonis]|uniref:OmpA family protein n=1 Tax=Campylobacter geochelonis TaxID=1780362 RepID=UPI0007707434|nr:OmpA family protein [Campylobacter geochelonis]CZE45780.1 outer membrane fibronectin-binding protein [Campylobacter geochelonis]